MKKTTQYEAIGRLIARKKGATTRELIEASGSVCPWKRIAEMSSRKGWAVWSQRDEKAGVLRYYGAKAVTVGA